jgi:hypothetical protein
MPIPSDPDRPEVPEPATDAPPNHKLYASTAEPQATAPVAAGLSVDGSEVDERIEEGKPDEPDGSRGRRKVAPSRFGLILVAVLAGSALFVGGYSLGAHIATTPGTPADQEARFAPFWDVYSLIQSDFAGSPRPSQDQLVEAAINGMMQSLDDP